MTHAETVRDIYAAFGRGDVATILGHLAEDVEWEYGGPPSTDVPWLQPRHGRAAVAGFFEALSAVDFHTFVPKAVLADGNLVMSMVDLDATVKATGKKVVEQDEVHIWHFNDHGQVARFRHRADTYLQWAAAQV